jgi:alkanesulfonate monooxygenase SsuD/methylene tetrahydromethanopterin reductase-like flavin-dependent oxidoreductase (luciferase family)
VKVGIALPTAIPGVERRQVLDRARRADAAGFSTLGTLDRLVYPNWEPLVALSAAAAVTERIGLMSSLLLLPYRQNAAVVAKQAATVHACRKAGSRSASASARARTTTARPACR